MGKKKCCATLNERNIFCVRQLRDKNFILSSFVKEGLMKLRELATKNKAEKWNYLNHAHKK